MAFERHSILCNLHEVSWVKDWSHFEDWITAINADKVVVLVDHHTFEYCYDSWASRSFIKPDAVIEIPPGEQFKTLTTAESIWQEMHQLQLSRNSLLICLGGGVVTDLGAFCASVYKRGMKCVHIPTTLLAQVDAAIGGKTGIDHSYLKNVIGTFHLPEAVFIDPNFLATLPHRQCLNGMAEVIKHALIKDEEIWNYLETLDDLTQSEALDIQLILRAAAIKCQVIDQDPTEKGIRKILNFGHTIGHGIESVLLESGFDILHGEAIAAGMEIEALLSLKVMGFDIRSYQRIFSFLRKHYPVLPIQEQDIPEIIKRMQNDKKNKGDQISFALLKGIGTADYSFYTDDHKLLADMIRAYILQ
jgi:3-dehydroquinate synthase